MARKQEYLKSGLVVGKVADVQEKRSKKGKGTPYLFISIQCGNPELGNVMTFGKIWGAKRIEEFLAYYTAHAAEGIELIGFFSQYRDANGIVRSNYSFVRFHPDHTGDWRAAFALRGYIAVKDLDDEGRPLLSLKVVDERTNRREQDEEESEAKEEIFQVYVHPRAEYKNIKAGASFDDVQIDDYVEVPGFLRTEAPRDRYGREMSDIRPYAMIIERLERPALP
ncbi:MAG: hypothetical protein IT388_00610 [Nitrospirales bacterium]|nr:hypothetical protein [Nitrospirales bacterium]